MLVFRAGIHKIRVKIANREDPDQTASLEASLIWVCSVCLGLFDRQLVFGILEHIPYMKMTIPTAVKFHEKKYGSHKMTVLSKSMLCVRKGLQCS